MSKITAKPENMLIDLHVHSTESDGTYTPEELITLAAKKGLTAIALTDHDTMNGLNRARAAAASQNLELVPGIELSTDYEGSEVHILGYFVDEKSPAFLKHLSKFREERDTRNEKMTKKLQEKGFDITMDQLREAYPDSILTRAHFARYLVENGYVKNRSTVFSRYLGDRCSCYVPREKITPFEAIDLIEMGGGLSYFAHPVLCRMNDSRLDEFVKNLTSRGLTGLEAVYSTNTPGEERNMRRLAQRYGLLISGGSDFHGLNKPDIHLGSGRGSLRVPYPLLEQMKERLHSLRQHS